MNILSKGKSAVAYDGGREAKAAGVSGRVVVNPGVNTLSEDDVKVLKADPNYARHVAAGMIVENAEAVANAPKVVAETGAAPAPAFTKVDAKGKPVKDKGEAAPAFAARLAAYEAEQADKPRTDFLVTFNGLSEAEQGAMYGTLGETEKGWVDADRAAKAEKKD